MKKFLITGCKSGLGKYLHQNLDDSTGLYRENFDEVKNDDYEYIIHCAFNKENTISDYKKYLQDNILLLLELKKIKHKKFIYFSSIDVYSENNNMYTLFKKFAETLLDKNDLILRCSALLGPDMKSNHIAKMKQNAKSLTLSKSSTFNYILYSDVLDFINSDNLTSYNGVIDFVSNNYLPLEETAKFFNVNIEFGQYEYNSVHNYENPIYELNKKYDKSSLDVLKEYNER